MAEGIAFEIAGAVLTSVLVASMPQAGPAIIFLPQLVISFGNGLLLPNCIAGAVSVRPQAAGTASGMTGADGLSIKQPDVGSHALHGSLTSRLL